MNMYDASLLRIPKSEQRAALLTLAEVNVVQKLPAHLAKPGVEEGHVPTIVIQNDPQVEAVVHAGNEGVYFPSLALLVVSRLLNIENEHRLELLLPPSEFHERL